MDFFKLDKSAPRIESCARPGTHSTSSKLAQASALASVAKNTGQCPPLTSLETTTCSQRSGGATGTAACFSGAPQSLSPIAAEAAPPLVRAQARSVYQPSARPPRVWAVCT